jgi:hypothetical protein
MNPNKNTIFFHKKTTNKNYFEDLHNLSSRICDAIPPFHYSTVHMSYSRAEGNILHEGLTQCNPTDTYAM